MIYVDHARKIRGVLILESFIYFDSVVLDNDEVRQETARQFGLVRDDMDFLGTSMMAPLIPKIQTLKTPVFLVL